MNQRGYPDSSMTETGFFLPGNAPSRAYRNIRDRIDGPAPKARAFIEHLWSRYRGLEDPHFLQDAQAHFLERFWEMYLAVAFMENGLMPVRERGVGPEFYFLHKEQKVWVEAVVPGPGDGDDRVEETEDVPTEKILLRFTNAVSAKRRRYNVALAKSLIRKEDCYVLAINSRGIPHAPYGNTLPFFLQALLPIGALTLVIDRATGKAIDSYYAFRDSVTKTAGAPVSTAIFLDTKYSFISAILHSGVDCVNCPPQLGGDFSVLHNPLASWPIGPSTFDWCDQYFYRDGALEKQLANQ